MTSTAELVRLSRTGTPTKCGMNIVVACWANDRTDHEGGKRVLRNEPVLAGCTPGAAPISARRAYLHKLRQTVSVAIRLSAQRANAATLLN